MFDGSGSWGAGVEAASWFREWLASNQQNSEFVSPASVNNALQNGKNLLPQNLIDDDVFGWSFSVVVAIVDDTSIQIGRCGAFAAVAVSRSLGDKLFAPTTLGDELAAAGNFAESDEQASKYSKIICSSFFGDGNEDQLIWTTPIKNLKGVKIVIGHATLPRFLTSCEGQVFLTDPETIRDHVEKFSGQSSPTAIISNP